MILFKLAFRSLWNRRLTTTLAGISIALSVALLIGVERVRLGTRDSFNNTISQTDLIVGARGSQLQLLLYSVFHIGEATNNIAYSSFKTISGNPNVEWTIPISLGDSHRGYRVVATDGSFYDHYRYRKDQPLELAQGKPAEDIFDVVLGSDVAAKLRYQVGDSVVLAHGLGESFTKHDDKPFRVVGILKRTASPIDRSLYISLYGMEAIHMDWKNGAPPLPGQETSPSRITKKDVHIGQITSFLLRCKSRILTLNLQRSINEFATEPLMAVIPGVALFKLWDTLSYAEDGLRVVSFFVILVGFFGMLIAIYTSLNERRREMAILRALGAGPLKIMFLLLVESFLLTLLGTALGVLLAYTTLFMAQPILANQVGLFIPIQSLSNVEWIFLAVIQVGGLGMGLVPALKAYRNALADGLTIKI